MTLKNIVLALENNELSDVDLVIILELVSHKLEINTISEMARIEGKSPNGIRTSKRYRKLKIGKQLFAIKGLNDVSLPF